jgi:membrane protein implicated in regulation of membrane protease activity
VDEIVGQEVVLLQDLPAGGEARAELRGASWSARSSGGVPLHARQRCRVERIDGLVLWVRAE